jgi:deltex-like protein
LTKYLFLVLCGKFENLKEEMNEEQKVDCNMDEKIIGQEGEIECQRRSVEVIANAGEEQNSEENGCESESVVIDLKVDEITWKYIQRMPVYAEAVKKVQSETQVSDIRFGLHKVEIRGNFHDAVMKAKVEIECIFNECMREVRTVVLPKLDPEIYSQVISFLEEIDTHRCTLTLDLQKVILTGKARDIDQLLGLLEETFGVTGVMPLSSDVEESSCPSKQSNEIADARDDNLKGSSSKQTSDKEPSVESSLKLADSCLSPDEGDNELYGTEENEFIGLEDDALTVDEKIWCYMEKHPDYSEFVKSSKEKSNLSIMREPVKSGSSKESSTNRLKLVFTGSDEAEVHASVHKTKSIVQQCLGADTKTLRVPCPELAVHQKIAKLLKAINRLPSYVAVEPEVIAITGNAVEIENCLEKLKTYGLVYEITQPQNECVPDDDDDDDHRPVQEAVDNTYTENRNQETTENSAPLPEHFEHYRQLPVPIEEFLWLYIEHRRRQELIDLRKDYNLQIIADGADMPDFVSITLASDSIDMLDCGQDAIVSLIVQLRQQVVLGVMDTASPEDLPQELQGMLQQQCRDMESIVVLKGSKICIIGPNEESMKCQQLVAAFLQNAVSDARNMGYDTSRMNSVGYGQGLEAADRSASVGNNLRQGYYGEDYNGTLGEENGDAEIRYAGGSDRHGTLKNVAETVPARASETGNHCREPCTKADHEVPEKVVLTDTSTVRQQEPEGNSEDESTINVLHPNPVCERRDGNSERVRSSNHSGGAYLKKENKDAECSICKGDYSSTSNRREMCRHHYCLSCVHLYFNERECPVCGTVDLSSKQKISQPDNGLMLTMYDNSFKLPGYENGSRGTIVVTYAFPPGIQSEELPNPGCAYPGLTTTAFFPMCLEGSKVVDLLQRAFEKRLVFKISQNQDNTNGNLVWNGILHKVNIFGGPQQSGYPDPIYLRRISNELVARGIRDTA